MTDLDSVWHYTTAEGLHGIITTNRLRATSHRFMNDSHEPTYATTVLKEAAASVREDLPLDQVERFDGLMKWAERRRLEAFLLCASREQDQLTLWRSYGSSVSYAIELDAMVDLLPIEQETGDAHPHPPEGWGPEFDNDPDGQQFVVADPDEVQIEPGKWSAVHYDTSVADARVRRIASLAAEAPNSVSDVMRPWLSLGGIDLLQLKHPAFADEREARAVFEVYPRWKFVKHRTTRFGLTPYIEVSSASGENQYAINDRFVKQAARLPIRSVQIGPSPLGDESVRAVSEFLEFNGYPDVPVDKSATPFR
ncbi:hypothetical protein [Humibacter sp.]|uniref:hypothetical protein n=1 Tax=Humibacter sp. TaxID=1940291 RepID=UPI003F81CC0B